MFSSRSPTSAIGAPGGSPAPPAVTNRGAQGYEFCLWNVENLDDDTDDPTNHDATEDWFARDPAALQAKLDLLADALVALDGGRGPDLAVLIEVENRRALDLLRETLNRRLEPAWQYPESGVIHHLNRTGRRNAPGILTRLPAREVMSGDFGIRRILAARVELAGAPLWVLASHWTSRLRGESVSDEKRAAYADVLYQTFLKLHTQDPNADILLCGDFNDTPSDEAVRDHLHGVADPGQVHADQDQPNLLNLTARLDPQRDGTYLFGKQWCVYDQILVSPGLLDETGWQLVPDSLQVAHAPRLRAGTRRGPLRFGGPERLPPRGPSDHFAVTVRLRVAGSG